MKKRMKACYKTYLLSVLICLLPVLFIAIGLYITWDDLPGLFFSVTAALINFFFFLYSVFSEIQWIVLRDGYVEVRSLYGIVKRVSFFEIKYAVYADPAVLQLQKLTKRIPCIVLSTLEELKLSKVQTASNKKEYPYVIVPYTAENEKMLKAAYRERTGRELQITL